MDLSEKLLNLAEEQHAAWVQLIKSVPREVDLVVAEKTSGSIHEFMDSVSTTWQPYVERFDPVPIPFDEVATEPSDSRDGVPGSPAGRKSDREIPQIRTTQSSKRSSGISQSSRRSSMTRSKTKSAMGLSHLMAGSFEERRCYFANYIENVTGVLVLMNSITMVMQLEFEGRLTGYQLGFGGGDAFAPIVPVLRYVDSAFVIMFTLELLIRVTLEKLNFFRDYANWFDIFLVLVGLVDMITSNLTEQGESVLQRLIRALKAFRSFRMIRSFRLFKGLRILARACQCFLSSLFWSMVMLVIFMMMGALLMGNLVQGYLEDSDVDSADKEWVWTHYGTAYNAFYTFFEITLSGSWPAKVRPLLLKVSQGLFLFFALYVTIIVFAVIRVIGAIFLRDTLDAAHNDAEHLVAERLKKKAQDVAKLEQVFRDIDESEDGIITEKVLSGVLSNPKCQAYFQTLDLDVNEGSALFRLLDQGDGEVTLDEFIQGIMRCRGPARAIDQVALHAEMKHLDAKLCRLLRHFTGEADAAPRRVEGMKAFRGLDASLELGLL